MLHPVGSRPPSVYWRRRLVLIGALVLVIVLIALTVSALTGGDSPTTSGKKPSDTPRPTVATSQSDTPSSRSATGTPTGKPSGTSSASGSGSASRSPSVMPPTCVLADLTVAAVVGRPTYKVGDTPLVELQVTNNGPKPCVRDLADKQIELRVYNGTSRVWGSHDCAIQPGTDKKTLEVSQPYRFAVLWGGLTSEVGCKQATRQRVGAGSYTLYASLSGKSGKAAQFSIS